MHIPDMKHSLVICPILLLFCFADGSSLHCSNSNLAQLKSFKNHSEPNTDFVIFGITQDCQIFFARLGDYDVFGGLSTSESITHCNPNLVKLHIRRYDNGFGLVLLIKQPNNKLCTLPIEFPRLSTLSGRKVFSYSLLSTLKFATCSHTSDESRSTLVPDLSFFDTTFSDILYFVDETSVGPIWTLRQFQMLKSGYLKPLDIYDITHPAFDSQKLDAYAKDNLVHTDGKSLYIWSRSKDTFHSTCAFNMIFRPKLAKTKAFKVQRHPREWLNSFSVDKSLIVYAESSRSSDFRWDTRIFAGDLRKSNETVCIGQSNVLVDLNVVSVASLLEMTHKDFSLFGNRTSQKTDVISNAEASKTTMASSLLRTSSTTVAKMPSSRTGQNRSNKSEDYDYSNSIFSNDLGYIINLGNFKTPETGASSKTKPSTNGADLGGLGDPERTVNNDRRVTSPEVSRPTPTTATPKSPTTPSATFQTDLTVSESGKITSDHQQNHYEIPTITTTEQPTPLKIDPVHDTSSSQDKMVNEVPSTLIGKSVILSLLSAAFSHILVAQI